MSVASNAQAVLRMQCGAVRLRTGLYWLIGKRRRNAGDTPIAISNGGSPSGGGYICARNDVRKSNKAERKHS